MKKATPEMLSAWDHDFEKRKEAILDAASAWPSDRTAYYVAADGDDANDGLSPATPWKSIEKVNADVPPYSVVLFRRGDVWRPSIPEEPGAHPWLLQTKSHVAYSAYGEGSKPGLYGSLAAADPACWLPTPREHVYEFHLPLDKYLDVGCIVADGGRMWGVKVLKSYTQADWCEVVGEVSNGEETFTREEEPFTGYRDLRSNMEFFHDWDAGRLYLYCSKGNPGTIFQELELMLRVHGMILPADAEDVLLDNLCIRYAGMHGVSGNRVYGLEVRHCEIGWIGGSVHAPGSRQFGRSFPTRLGNAVEAWSSCKGFYIHDNYIHQIYDCGPTVQFAGKCEGRDHVFEDVDFSYNAIELLNSPLEVWNAVSGDDVGPECGIRRMHLHHNLCRGAGMGWSRQRFNNSANMFYSDLGVSRAWYDDVQICDNVFVGSRYYLFKARYVHKTGYRWHHNVFCHHRYRWFGMLPARLEDCSGEMRVYPYTDEVIEQMEAAGVVEDSEFFYSDEE